MTADRVLRNYFSTIPDVSAHFCLHSLAIKQNVEHGRRLEDVEVMNSAGKVDTSGWFPMPILAHTQTDGLVLRSRQEYIRLTEFAIPSIFRHQTRKSRNVGSLVTSFCRLVVLSEKVGWLHKEHPMELITLTQAIKISSKTGF